MKVCKGCTSSIADEAMYCPICGCQQDVEKRIVNRFCSSCGKEMSATAAFCVNCGNASRNVQPQVYLQKVVPEIISQLATRILVASILWICISVFQLGLALLMGVVFLLEPTSDNLFAIIVYGALGILNLCSAINDIHYQKKIQQDFVGIIYEKRITIGLVLLYLYNAYVILACLTSGTLLLFLLGLLSLAVVIVELFGVYISVLVNKRALIQLERAQLGTSNDFAQF